MSVAAEEEAQAEARCSQIQGRNQGRALRSHVWPVAGDKPGKRAGEEWPGEDVEIAEKRPEALATRRSLLVAARAVSLAWPRWNPARRGPGGDTAHRAWAPPVGSRAAASEELCLEAGVTQTGVGACGDGAWWKPSGGERAGEWSWSVEAARGHRLPGEEGRAGTRPMGRCRRRGDGVGVDIGGCRCQSWLVRKTGVFLVSHPRRKQGR